MDAVIIVATPICTAAATAKSIEMNRTPACKQTDLLCTRRLQAQNVLRRVARGDLSSNVLLKGDGGMLGRGAPVLSCALLRQASV